MIHYLLPGFVFLETIIYRIYFSEIFISLFLLTICTVCNTFTFNIINYSILFQDSLKIVDINAKLFYYKLYCDQMISYTYLT